MGQSKRVQDLTKLAQLGHVMKDKIRVTPTVRQTVYIPMLEPGQLRSGL